MRLPRVQRHMGQATLHLDGFEVQLFRESSGRVVVGIYSDDVDPTTDADQWPGTGVPKLAVIVNEERRELNERGEWIGEDDVERPDEPTGMEGAPDDPAHDVESSEVEHLANNERLAAGLPLEDSRRLGALLQMPARPVQPVRTCTATHCDTGAECGNPLAEGAERCERCSAPTDPRTLDVKPALSPEEQAERDLLDGLPRWTWAQLQAAAPRGWEAVLVAEPVRDQSEMQSDYFGHTTGAPIVIGYAKSTREHFGQLRAAAATFPPTAHLGPDRDCFQLSLAWDHDSSDTEAKYRAFLDVTGQAYYRGWRVPVHFAATIVGLEDEFAHDWPTFETEAARTAWRDAHPAPAGTRWEESRESYEHRENYANGGGNYLKAGSRHGDGWRVVRRDLGRSNSVMHTGREDETLRVHLPKCRAWTEERWLLERQPQGKAVQE